MRRTLMIITVALVLCLCGCSEIPQISDMPTEPSQSESLPIKDKEILKTQEKFYLADTALRYSVLGYNADSVASSLENVVYLELCRRGYTVNVGKSGSGEIDFVAVRQNEKLYVQVTQELRSPKTEKREFERLLEIHDNYPKYVLTTDEFSGGNYEGIKTMHIADFLLSSEY